VSLSTLSDNLLVVAIFGYLVAMLLHTAEYTLGNRRVAEPDQAAERVLVTAGAPADGPGASAEPLRDQPPEPVTPAQRDLGAKLGLTAIWVTVFAVLAHFGTVGARGLAAHRLPWGNMYEFVLSVTFVGAVVWLALAIGRPQIRLLGIVLTLVQLLLLGFAGMVLYTQVDPLVPALQSYWFLIHVTTVVLASGLFLVGFVPAAMFLIRDGHDAGKTRFPYTLGGRLPAAESMERLAFRVNAFAFPLWTFAVSAGAIWAEAAWGRYWGWDPKETWAFISWVVYAGYLHARSTPSISRRIATWIAILGWLTILMNLFGVNFFFTGLHSYAK
jgi:cytochrome c-type biogenesis protein CcsB